MSSCEVCALRSKIHSLKIRIALFNARKNGRHPGRPPKGMDLAAKVKIFDMRVAGFSYREIEKQTNVHRMAIKRLIDKKLQQSKPIVVGEQDIKELEFLLAELKTKLKGDQNGNKEYVRPSGNAVAVD